ncbi:hypothetical protein LCGC14_3145290, partial [marine sediment metagenome]
YLIAVLSAIVVFGAFLIGHSVNGIPAELAIMLGLILGSTETLLVLLIRHFFKI